MDETAVAIPFYIETDYALLAVGLAWLAILGVLAAGLVTEAVTRCLHWVVRKKGAHMFWLIRNAGEHYIELGRVYCPRAECDVELDKCLGCEHVKSVKGGRTPSVICSPPTRILPAPY
jgi:hypothetical protein